MSRLTIAAIVLTLVSVTPAWPQSGEVPDRQAPQPAVALPLTPALIGGRQEAGTGQEFPYSEPLSPPGIITGDQPSLAFLSETARSNFLTGTLQVSSGFDDNALSTPSNHVSNMSYLMAPGIEMAQARERWNWKFDYYPGFTINQRLSQQNQAAHTLNFDTTYRLSPHVALRLRDAFEMTTTLFSGAFSNQLTPGFGSLQQPNQSVITPLAERTGNTSGMDLAYQFGAGSMVGGGATYYFVNYKDVASATGTTASLIDTQSLAGAGFYAHRFANQHWVGATYNYQRLTFDPGNRTTIDRILLFYSLPLHDHMALELWAGPEYSRIGAPVIDSSSSFLPGSQWSPAGGIAYNWQGQRTSLRAEYSYRISDGGGLSAAVTLQNASAGMRRQLTTRWAAGLSVQYLSSDPLAGTPGAFGSIRTLSADAKLERRITDNLSLGFAYGRDRQNYGGAAPTSPVERNRGWVSLSYSFTRPLGR